MTLVWGSGKIFRDFLYVDDLAEAILKVYELPKKKYNSLTNGLSHINIGSGEEISIHELALMIKKVVGFEGKIKFDNSKPDGTPRKLLDTSIMNKKGWKPKIKLKKGIKDLYTYYKTYV